MATDVETVAEPRRFQGEPMPRVLVSDAIKRQWPIVLLPTLLLLGLGIYLGLSRAPQYTAEARLTVGRLDVDPASLANFANATQALAGAYSRAVDAGPVVDPVARQLKLTPNQIRAKVSASPIPESPVIRVVATDTSAGRAVTLANSTSTTLVQYTSTLNRTDTSSARLLAQYRAASLEVNTLQDRHDQLQRVHASKSSISALDADLSAARLRAQAVSTEYQATEQQRGTSKIVGVLTQATGASNDRTSKLELLALAGALAGLLLGAAIATLRVNRMVRRSFRP
jgi:capsular polysaccharide biosynthesis protein